MNIRVGTEQACRIPPADHCLRGEKGGALNGQQVGLSPQEHTRKWRSLGKRSVSTGLYLGAARCDDLGLPSNLII